MKVIPLRGNKTIYTCNAYLILGDWNRLEDINTLVDVGSDGAIIDEIEMTSTGVGKKAIERVVLTHNHFDHAGGLRAIKEKYHPRVYAFTEMDGVDGLLAEGEILRLGDRDFEVVHIPCHSDDSVCLYCKKDRILFSGDTPLRIMTIGGSYSPGFVAALERLAARRIATIYSGHDLPITEGADDILRMTLMNVKNNETVNCLSVRTPRR